MYEGGVIIIKVNTKKFYHILYSASSVGGSRVQIPRGPAAVKPECPADERGILSEKWQFMVVVDQSGSMAESVKIGRAHV